VDVLKDGATMAAVGAAKAAAANVGSPVSAIAIAEILAAEVVDKLNGKLKITENIKKVNSLVKGSSRWFE